MENFHANIILEETKEKRVNEKKNVYENEESHGKM